MSNEVTPGSFFLGFFLGILCIMIVTGLAMILLWICNYYKSKFVRMKKWNKIDTMINEEQQEEKEMLALISDYLRWVSFLLLRA